MVEENVSDVCDWGKVERDQDNVEEVVDLMSLCFQYISVYFLKTRKFSYNHNRSRTFKTRKLAFIQYII